MKVLDSVSEVRDECHDRAGRRDVYLTFDDGPNPLCTPDVLEALAEHRVPATFCVIGAYVEDQPKLIERVIAEGHEIANRTTTHPDLSGCEPDEVRREIFGREQDHRDGMSPSRSSAYACPLRNMDGRSGR
ncbi:MULTISPECIES: polysaccharide deacetylase family protein [Paraburkholderia]|uniref:polysaccharide deacetylase family protein n=1 Tax=Paraburkholderia TaxID=1822464 RepID=UPI001CA3B665|nr:polysaccharide deacetylase family protein [Paraburkholderia podalyriae]